MSKTGFSIAVMPGDGIGVEVMEAADAVLVAVEQRHGLRFDRRHVPGGAGHYRDTGTAMDEDAFRVAAEVDAVLFGAMGLPHITYPDGTECAPQLDLRVRLDLYAGVRPIRAIPGVPPLLAHSQARDIDLVILRESTEGLFWSRGKGTIEDDREARETLVITRDTTERLSRFAFELARRRAERKGRPGRVTVVDKSNVFRAFAFMQKIFFEVAANYGDVKADRVAIDATALDMVRKPWTFDVMPTENMFGDILSDLGAGLIGGMGFAPSADVGDDHAMFQPCHGSAPDIAGQGIANPTAMILSSAMMLEWLGERHGDEGCLAAAREIEAAVDTAFGSGAVRSYDMGGTDGTAAVTSAIIERLGVRSAA